MSADSGRGVHRARKRFGQHFLVDAAVVHAIVEAIGPREGERLVEIGPGLAALTGALLARIGHLHAVEIDRDLAARLRARYAPERLTLHEADALRFDFAALAGPGEQRLRIVGNLPYNVSSPLLIRLLEFRACVRDQHFMLQREVVERIVAGPGTRDYGRLSVLLQAFYEVEHLFDVPPQAFDPPPKVESSVVRMRVRDDRLRRDPAPLQQVLAAAFAQRRKMIRTTLLPWLEARGAPRPPLAGTLRPEQIDLAAWLSIADGLAAASTGKR
ncbi:MAG: 16S rRNA (adenine(1518)-N(6)/adenine(1519)-N(6))-dimethyltransferase [Burkholderiales bacterium]|nr:MAG: 16S rRNA (adenine(1518)-N(6)/adenine(1519)-N(6))-dimethyltransferase [Burkholderiales bacterium]